jgi:hypothetical protein
VQRDAADRKVGRHEEKHLSERWQEFAAYADAASAEVAAGLLRSEGVPVNVASDEPMPGLIHGFRLMVPAEMLHRARWVVSNATFTDEELAFFATASLDSAPASDGKQS